MVRMITAAKEALARGQQNPASITFWTRHIPPGVNNLYANVAGRGRVRSERYREWAVAAGWDANGLGHISGPFTVSIVLCESVRRKNVDLDGKAKATLDLLVTHHIVDDDSLCQELHMAWSEAAGGMRVTIKPVMT